MQVILVWFANLVVTIAGYFFASLSKKVAFGAAAIAAALALTTIMALAIKALLVGIVYTLPDWAAAGAAFLPSNLAICLSSIIGAKMARFAYDYNMQTLKMVSYIT